MTPSQTFKDSQVALLEHNFEYAQRHDECPVCHWDLKDEDYKKVYSYKGIEYPCPDNDYGHVMYLLAKRYWLSFIPLEYQMLLWEEFPYPELAKDIENYIENFKRIRLSGMGFTFWSETMGTGKTWAATHILKELVKQGYDCHFALFMGMPSYYELDDPEDRALKMRRIREAEVLVLDDVKAPFSEAQRNFFEDKMEQLLRERLSSCFPTIVTSNLSSKEFARHYPRCSSLLAAKNQEVELRGTDWRQNSGWLTNQELYLQGETRPIT